MQRLPIFEKGVAVVVVVVVVVVVPGWSMELKVVGTALSFLVLWVLLGEPD